MTKTFLNTTVLLALCACVDIAPLKFTPPDAAPKPVFDAAPSTDAAVDTGPDPCALCFMTPAAPGPGCGESYAACQADEKCGKTVVCALGRGCFAQPSQPDVINCGSDCAVAAGIAGATDPSVGLIFPVIGCALGTCMDACKGGRAP